MTEANMSDHADLTIDNHGVATLKIVNAGSLNILGTPVIAILRRALAQVKTRPELRVLVLRGEGDKAFVAGADIKEMASFDVDRARAFIDGLRLLCEDVRQLPVPVIARIPGWCLGGGLEFALACDLRIASTHAKLGMPEVKVGIPSIIHAALLPRLVGQARADWILLTGEVIEAQEALAQGLVHRVMPAEQLDEEVTRVARLLAEFGPVVLAQQKRLLRQWEKEPLDTSIQNGVEEFAQAFLTGEPQRYMNEFLQAKTKKD
ncbi:enoyl-CoA hydratase [Bordetella sp. 02P26C-1]|uniref:enoyl-CoA hydratase n=1 Tax=Bordetella sp. 02P26C-1 TaxID=2683195 RepID=UPI001352E52D|nr:enoyl-CoA hydratase [Bordetella sp. 02P26C-1]MVW77637.1 enoyl-CoA hydratase [Bordetella sp. 02P26C-1]